jgi:drug/metabolite transporter (DMT)-like permease
LHWFFPAVFSALCLATSDALIKRWFSAASIADMAALRLFYGAVWLIGPILFLPAPALPPAFWWTLAAALPFEFTALLLYMAALKSSPLSLSIPFLAFTPVFMLLNAFVILGEEPSAFGAGGVVLVAAGAYVLNLDARRHGFLGPIRAVASERGSVMMLIVSFCFSITATLGKRMILLSDPVYFGAMYFLLLPALFLPVQMALGRLDQATLTAKPVKGLLVGLGSAGMILFHVWAISMAPAAYMIAVKRLSLVFSVVYGRLLFKEERFSQRFLGAAVMFSGVILILTLG